MPSSEVLGTFTPTYKPATLRSFASTLRLRPKKTKDSVTSLPSIPDSKASQDPAKKPKKKKKGSSRSPSSIAGPQRTIHPGPQRTVHPGLPLRHAPSISSVLATGSVRSPCTNTIITYPTPDYQALQQDPRETCEPAASLAPIVPAVVSTIPQHLINTPSAPGSRPASSLFSLPTIQTRSVDSLASSSQDSFTDFGFENENDMTRYPNTITYPTSVSNSVSDMEITDNILQEYLDLERLKLQSNYSRSAFISIPSDDTSSYHTAHSNSSSIVHSKFIQSLSDKSYPAVASPTNSSFQGSSVYTHTMDPNVYVPSFESCFSIDANATSVSLQRPFSDTRLAAALK